MGKKTPQKSTPIARAGKSTRKGGPHATRAITRKAPKRKRTPPRTWQQVFIMALSLRPVVSYAADVAGIDRTTAYDHRRANSAFAAAWDEALAKGIERAESEAWRRAVEGTKKPVYQGGARVGEIREFSDTLLMFMLRAHRPETYRERVDVTIVERKALKLAKELGLDEEDAADIVAIARKLESRLYEKSEGMAS